MSMLPAESAPRSGPYVEELLCQAEATPHAPDAREDGGHDTPVAHVVAHASHVIAQVQSAGGATDDHAGATDGWDGFLDAVAQNESGGKARGHKGDLEIGAGTIGASGMDASYGRYQTTADKAVGVLRKNPEVAAREYGLSEGELATLGDRMNATRAFWAVITEGKPAAIGRGKQAVRFTAVDAALARHDAGGFVAKWAAIWTRTTGLGRADLGHMLAGLRIKELTATKYTDRSQRSAAAHRIFEENRALFTELGMSARDLTTFLKGKNDAEHLAGFHFLVDKAAGGKLHAATIRNAGEDIGRLELKTVREEVLAAARRFGLAIQGPRHLYMLCARAHNAGVGKLHREHFADPSALAHYDYVQKMLAHLDGPRPARARGDHASPVHAAAHPAPPAHAQIREVELHELAQIHGLGPHHAHAASAEAHATEAHAEAHAEAAHPRDGLVQEHLAQHVGAHPAIASGAHPASSSPPDGAVRALYDRCVAMAREGRLCFPGNQVPGASSAPFEEFTRALYKQAGYGQRRINVDIMKAGGPHARAIDMRAYLESVQAPIPAAHYRGKPENGRMHRKALPAFLAMHAAAAQEGVPLVIVHGFRPPKVKPPSKNAKAVANNSSHSYGLAIDLQLSVDAAMMADHHAFRVKETSTKDMVNYMHYYESPVLAWMLRRARDFDFYPYQAEPWHYEFNPQGMAAEIVAGAHAHA
ncbi:MAG: D-alanyl-D-alanine carboxypeptidase family protein [Deltaproteobacteria bacterium]|nr:D-alanyl-D-alanine carboxypeptidase family protein [Deltaproteobacteria bacterium]